MFLPDVNMWLALAFESHIHHPAARIRFDDWIDEQVGLCRVTQQGLLRLATNPKAFGDEAVTLAQAWQLYDAFLADPRVSFVDEPAKLEGYWRDYTQGQTYSPKVWTDAYLAAFARAADFELVTFDQGFTEYADLRCTILS